MAWCIWVYLSLFVISLVRDLYQSLAKDDMVKFVISIIVYIGFFALLYFGGAFRAIGLG